MIRRVNPPRCPLQWIWQHLIYKDTEDVRGLLPENSIPAFTRALELGVTTLELDVVISKDKQVLVSHEPWLSSEICMGPDGNPIPDAGSRQTYNIFQMTYAEIREFDCGSKVVESFPQQEKIPTYKPLLSEVIDSTEAYLSHNGGQVFYNIETKSQPKGDGIYHPEPKEFVSLLLQVLEEKKLEGRVIIQSFDPRTLQEVHQQAPNLATALLIGSGQGNEAKTQIEQLGYKPPIYSPNWQLVDAAMIAYLHEEQVKVIPWTVNEEADMRSLIDLGVDGIISDYPDRLIKVLKEMQQ